MRVFSVFTGVGGFDIAIPKEWECVGFSEIDKYANMVLKYHFPNIKNFGDINEIDWNKVSDFDILFGGTPCQDLSLAGKRKGLAGSRSGLFYKFVEALRQKTPDYFIWENVKGALSSNKGHDFATVLNQFSEAGYSLWWQVLNAKDFGVPQNRERIFVCGFRKRSPPEIFFEPRSDKENNGIQEKLISNTLNSYSSKENKPIELTQNTMLGNRVYSDNGISPTLQTSSGGRHIPMIVQAVITPSRIEKKQNGRRFKEPEEPMFALTGQDRHGILIHNMQPRSPLRPSANRGGSGHLTRNDGLTYTIDTGNTNAVEFDGKIRRLTPLECERLMSWEDEWTRFGIDEKGNKVEISDSQRYKMTGNGVVSNVVKWIIENVILSEI